MSTRTAITAESQSPMTVALAAGGGVAAAMGVGRFAYTPLLPIMTQQTGLTPAVGAVIATVNYGGYLAGAICLSMYPRLGTRRWTAVAMSGLLIASEFVMPTTTSTFGWALSRFVAGIASAFLFVSCVQRAAAVVPASRRGPILAGIAFAGVGIGIALSGTAVTVLGDHVSWRGLWIIAASLTAALLTPLTLTWRQGTPQPPNSRGAGPDRPALSGWALLAASYFLEGVGYIIVGTFLVASIVRSTGESWGPPAWIVVGLAAAPGTIIWTWLGHRFGTRTAMFSALIIQAIGAAIPAMSSNVLSAMIAAVLFGGTFMGITALAIQIGVELHGPHAAGPLTAIYGVGQMLGPLVVAPMLGTAYTTAFSTAAIVIAGAATLAAMLRIRHRDGVGR